MPFYGVSILCSDDANIRSILHAVEKRYITYGINNRADITVADIEMMSGKSKFRVLYKGMDMGKFELSLPGMHNISNALSCIGVAVELDINIDDVKKALRDFSGVERRFQIVGRIESQDILVVDDYGHHPTEIKATLAAAKAGWGRRTIVLFQPHRYTRTRDLLNEFAGAFSNADVLLVTDIYPAGEQPVEGVNGKKLFNAIREQGHRNVWFVPDRKAIPEKTREVLMQGDMVITLGAGDIWKAGREIVEMYNGEKLDS